MEITIHDFKQKVIQSLGVITQEFKTDAMTVQISCYSIQISLDIFRFKTCIKIEYLEKGFIRD